MRLIIADHFREFANRGLGPPPMEDTSTVALLDRVPPRDDVVAADLIVLFGPFNDGDRALQIAGSLNAALQVGRTVVYACRVRPESTDLRTLERMIALTVNPIGTAIRATPVAPAFTDYFTAFGLAGATFPTIPDDSESLALAEYQNGPCAFATPVGPGMLYVLPWHVAQFTESYEELATALIDAVMQHREGASLVLPAHLTSLRLSGEQALLDEIANLENELDSRRQTARELERFRHLLGRVEGDALERLVIDALNVVLAATPYEAEDREDVGREDFWITGQEGDLALAEVKGVGTGVRRPHVNQVDNHRAELDLETEAMPGLLVVNPFRGAESLERKREQIHPDVIRHLRRQNVVLLRGADLYELLSRTTAGEPAAEHLLAALASGGGWLEVTASDVALHADD
jgi:hypothetical protein